MSEMQNVNVTPETPATMPAPQPVSEKKEEKKGFFAKTGEKIKAAGTWIKENWKTVAVSALAGGALVYIGMQLAQPQETVSANATTALPCGGVPGTGIPEVTAVPEVTKIEPVTMASAPVDTVPFGE